MFECVILTTYLFFVVFFFFIFFFAWMYRLNTVIDEQIVSLLTFCVMRILYVTQTLS